MTTQDPRPGAEMDAALTKALHEAETTGGWWGHPECEEFARIISPTAQGLMAQAWDEGWDQGTSDAWLRGGHKGKPNPYRPTSPVRGNDD